jgi:hypothetical protein
MTAISEGMVIGTYMSRKDIGKTPDQGVLIIIPLLERSSKFDMPFQYSTRQDFENRL